MIASGPLILEGDCDGTRERVVFEACFGDEHVEARDQAGLEANRVGTGFGVDAPGGGQFWIVEVDRVGDVALVGAEPLDHDVTRAVFGTERDLVRNATWEEVEHVKIFKN